MSISTKRRSLRLKMKCSPDSVSEDDSVLLNLSDSNIKKNSNCETRHRDSSPNKSINYIHVTDKDDNLCGKIDNDSKEYLFEFYHQNNHCKQLNHKYYGCRKKTSHKYGESFGLPDQPIFSNNPVFSKQKERSPLDTYSADPWDICVLDLKLIDQPWLVEYPEVITPYWDVESLFPFDDVRKKNEPELIDCFNEWTNENFNFSIEIIESTPDNCMYTSTPLKKNKISTTLLSTLNITKAKQDIDIAHLKDQVVKALEEAIKDNKELANVDMKIKVLKKTIYNEKKNEEFVDLLESNIKTIKFSSQYSSHDNIVSERQNINHIGGNYSKNGKSVLSRVSKYCNTPMPKRVLRSDMISKEGTSFNATNECIKISTINLSDFIKNKSNLGGTKILLKSLHNQFSDLDTVEKFKKQENSKNLFSNRPSNIQSTIKFNNGSLDENLLVSRELRSHKLKSNLHSSIKSSSKFNIVWNKFNHRGKCVLKSFEDSEKAYLSSSLPILKFNKKDEVAEVSVKIENYSDNESHNEKIDFSQLKIKTEIGDYPESNIVHNQTLNNLNDSLIKQPGEKNKASNSQNENSIYKIKEIKQEVFSYGVGEHVWAHLAKYPYWPAIICYDPENNIYYKNVNKQNKLSATYYHIRFFGDNGRRAWIHKNHLMHYCSKHDLEMIVNKMKSEGKSCNVVKPYVIAGGQIIGKWNKAVEELESVKGQTYDEIHNYLLNCWATYQELKKQKKAEKTRLDVRFQSKNSKRKQSASESIYSVPDITTYRDENVKSRSQTNSVDKRKNENSKTIREIRNKEQTNLNNIQATDLLPIYSDNKTNCDNLQQKDNPVSGINGKQFEECPHLQSKPNTNNLILNLYSFEHQTELHRKNNLFNGFRNIKVCDYCFKQGNIVKCKGKCGNHYHLKCAANMYQKRIIEKKAKNIECVIKNENEASNKATKNDFKDEQVQIITVKSRCPIATPLKMDVPTEYHKLSLADQIDYKMKEVMNIFESSPLYQNESTDSSSEEGSVASLEKNNKGSVIFGGSVNIQDSGGDLDISINSDKRICHVTADSVVLNEEKYLNPDNFKCFYCMFNEIPSCFACGLEVSTTEIVKRKKCSYFRCRKYFHEYCLKTWPQTQWSIGKWSRNNDAEDTFTCPGHICHTCFSDEFGFNSRSISEKLARCVHCPAAFHATNFCIPAGSVILGGSQIICPRHGNKVKQPINTFWCFICSKGGKLICCDTCPTSVHPECQPITLTDDDKYICEDCESGRFPLYDEVVWVKLGHYRWWPALILFPNEIPENIKLIKHQEGDFVVRFFGTNDHYWANKSRSFLFQEGDSGGSLSELNKSKNRILKSFKKAIEDATLAFKLKKEYKLKREAETINSLKPPPFVKINKNKPVGNVKTLELNVSNVTACECDPNKPLPCGPDSDCINRLLMTECDPEVCSATTNCKNQAFQKREYIPVIPYKTQGRGWGLKCLTPIKKDQFIIEYVGELIDSEEYQRRIRKMHAQKDENYYFMTIDSERVIDAGPKGNYSRFMNHSCNPNCVTQKWTIKGETRVGLFANCDVESGSELTFNYNFEVAGQEKKVCKCGAANCSGFIGVKAKTEKTEKVQNDTETKSSSSRSRRTSKKKHIVQIVQPVALNCFICNGKDVNIICTNKACNKGYHRKCLNLEDTLDTSKFACPRHNCNVCSNRTIRCCVKCTNSFCPTHAETNVRYDNFVGFVCRIHDPEKTEIVTLKSNKKRRRTSNLDATDDFEVSSTTLGDQLNVRKSIRSRKKRKLNSKVTVELERVELAMSSPIKSLSSDNNNLFGHEKNRRKRKRSSQVTPNGK